MYSLKKAQWTCIYRSDPDSCPRPPAPIPRYAHSLVYDPVDRVHYLFGGNPGAQPPQLRLDDFWALHLQKQIDQSKILQQCRYLIRTKEYETLAKTDPILGMQYLQTQLYQVIDQSNQEQLKHFHKLATLLFKTQESSLNEPIAMSPDSDSIKWPESMDDESCTSVDLFHFNMEQLAQLSDRNLTDQQSGRYDLYNQLISYFPERLCQPKPNLTDYIII